MKHIESFYGEDNFAEAAAPTDSELAAQVRDGNNEAFAELWGRHEKALGYVAQRAGTSVNDVEDVLQDVAIKLWRDLQKNDRELDQKKGARNFTSRIVANHVKDLWRRQSRRLEEELVETYADFDDSFATPLHESPEEVVVSAMASEAAVDELLSQVRPERREPMQAIYIDGYSATEYAEASGVSRGTALSRSHRGREELRAYLDTQTEPSLDDSAIL